MSSQAAQVATSAAATEAAAAAATAPTKAAAPATSGARTRADELTDELATLDLAWEKGTITDERAYQRIRESLLAQLVAEVGSGSGG